MHRSIPVKLIPALFLILSSISLIYAENLLINPNFEDGVNSWDNWGGKVSEGAVEGKGCVVVKNTEFKWSGMDQMVRLPANARTCEVTGWMKTENVVQGSKEWEQAQITIEFVDETGEHIGNYPSKTGEMIGTNAWEEFSSMYSVEFGAYAVKLVIALGNATGTAWFDNLSLKVMDNDGKVVTRELIKLLDNEDMDNQKKYANQLINGGFENDVDGWEADIDNIADGAHSGKNCLVIENEKYTWKGIEQKIALPENAHKVVVSGWMKTDNVAPGKEDWAKANMSIEFQNAGGARIGDYPPSVGEAVGNTKWTYYQNSYKVRNGTKKVLIGCALDHTKGKVFYDDLKVVIFDRNGKELKAKKITGPTDEGEWYPLDQNNTNPGSHYVDWSSLLDAPAGKHGFLKVSGDEFEFEDGTPCKFFGVVICGAHAFVSKEKADLLTTRLSKMGVNLLRLHHLDADWAEPNIFGNTKGTRKLSEKQLDKLDYLIASCKKKGIYIFLDLLVHRKFYPEDGIEEEPAEPGAKQVGFFSKKLIDLQKEYIDQIFNHKNTYTGLAYKDEPAIALSEFINETTIFTNFGEDKMKKGYRKELETLWENSKYKDKKLARFKLSWDTNPRGILKNNVAGAHVRESIEFMTNIEIDYFSDMLNHIRKVGVKYPLTGSNMPLPILGLVKSSSTLDYVANDAYWDHPKLWKIKGGWERIKYAPIDNASQLQLPQSNSIEAVSYYNVHEKPYMIWGNHSYPNEYQLEELPFIAAYASLQGWSGMLQHEFDHVPLGADSLESMTVNRQPEDIAMSIIAAPLFLRGYIKKAPGEVVEKITHDMIVSDSSYSNMIDRNYFLPFVTRVSKTFTGSGVSNPENYKKYFDEKKQIIKSETGELILNADEGVMEINAPKVQGVVGFIKNKKYDFPLFEIMVQNTHATVMAVSKDDKPLTESKHFYLVAVASSKMTGQEFKPSRTALKTLGSLPVLQQVVNGSVVFKNRKKRNKIKVIPLSPTGKAGKALSMKKIENGMAIDLSKEKTFVYEVIVGRI